MKYSHFFDNPSWGEGHEDECDVSHTFNLPSGASAHGRIFVVCTEKDPEDLWYYHAQSIKIVSHSRIGGLLVFDITSRQSFDELKSLRGQTLTELEGKTFPTVVVGLKSDLEEQRAVSSEEAENLAKEWNSPYIEVSSKTRKNVKECFNEILKLIESSDYSSNINDDSEDKDHCKCVLM